MTRPVASGRIAAEETINAGEICRTSGGAARAASDAAAPVVRAARAFAQTGRAWENSLGEARAEGAAAGRPGLCRNCGAITGAGETSCHVCGAPTAAPARQPARRPHYDEATVRFARAVLARPATFTFVFLAATTGPR